MAVLSDSLTVAILLCLIFGAVAFYMYSRLTQNEKRVGLLENLLLSLKMSTEASLQGPDSVEPVSSPAPLSADDVDTVEEESYAELLKELSPSSSSSSSSPDAVSDEKDAAALLRSMTVSEKPQEGRKMDVNYESMSVKELQGLAKQRGLVAGSQRKKDLIELLKKESSPSYTSLGAGAGAGEAGAGAAAEAAAPAAATLVEFDGADAGTEGFVLGH